METGSDTSTFPVFREELHLTPDRPDGPQDSGSSVFLGISRSSLALLTVDGLKAVELRSFSYPHCRDDARWAAVVAHILKVQGVNEVKAAVVDSVPCSVIPSDLFPGNTDQLRSILHLEHGALDGLTAVISPLEVWDAQCAALVPEALLKVLPSDRVMPSLCCWTPSLLRSPVAHHAHVHVSTQDFSLAVLKGRDLILHNSFAHQSPEDILYFCMAALEQLSILHTEVRLSLYGDVAEGDALHGLFRRYISDVVFAERPSELTCPYSFKELAGHRLPFLLNAPLCAS